MSCSGGVIPYLLTPDCDKHSKWIIEVFGAKEGSKYLSKDGKYVMHMSLSLNDGEIYMADEFFAEMEQTDNGALNIDDPKGVKRGQHCYVQAKSIKQLNTLWQKAIQKGASEHVALEDKFWGERFGIFKDPWGYLWSCSTSVNQIKEPNEHLKIQKVHKDARTPSKPDMGYVGFTLHAAENVKLTTKKWVSVDTGLIIQPPKNSVARIFPLSKKEVDVQEIVLDGSCDIQNSLKIQVRSLGGSGKIEAGDEIAQLIVEKSILPEVELQQ
eukprot:TRINITY_DN1271_c0_g1_i1.p1 TRINITY_DN1271_c0_g1~~TRINITY_DN1271_c0_g1_i1.p1  ORF type:complete len:269 (-),score=34.71 TRINITY_DN1271_c0_g1_i1:161-967(-)